VPKAVYRSGYRDKHNLPRPLTPQSIMPSLNHCDLLRHVGVNNLPKVVTRQRRGRELNSQPASCKSNALSTPWINPVCQSLEKRNVPATYMSRRHRLAGTTMVGAGFDNSGLRRPVDVKRRTEAEGSGCTGGNEGPHETSRRKKQAYYWQSKQTEQNRTAGL